jgi:hypothetical protein
VPFSLLKGGGWKAKLNSKGYFKGYSLGDIIFQERDTEDSTGVALELST